MKFQDGYAADAFANKLDKKLQGTPYKGKAIFAFVQISGKDDSGEHIWDVSLCVDPEKTSANTTPEMAKKDILGMLKDELDGYEPDVVVKATDGHQPDKRSPIYPQYLIN